MKKLSSFLMFIVLCSFCSLTYIHAEVLSPSAELYFLTVTPNNNDPIMTLNVTAQSMCWWSQNYYQSLPWNTIWEDQYSGYYNSSYTPAGNNQATRQDLPEINGWNFISTPPITPNIGYGIYKVTNNRNNTYFYIDFRDQRYGYDTIGGMGCNFVHMVDLWLKYNSYQDSVMFSYLNNSNLDCSWTEIHNGELLNIWKIKYGQSSGNPITSDFVDYWANCLAVINKDNNDHPTLVWGPYSDSNSPHFVPKHYRVYRKFGGDFEILADNISVNTFFYTDNSLHFYSQLRPVDVYYYVCGVDSNYEESSQSNTVTARVSNEQEKRKPGNSSGNKPFDFLLAQNYPNPFNPTTQISFSIPQTSLVQLKVYDVYGRELQSLVDGFLSEGTHSYQFNGKNFASGVYFYSLNTGNYTAVRKMILVK